ncbi:hypothetical protein pb186bvf_016572 [Paramecium bursaria]
MLINLNNIEKINYINNLYIRFIIGFRQDCSRLDKYYCKQTYEIYFNRKLILSVKNFCINIHNVLVFSLDRLNCNLIQ